MLWWGRSSRTSSLTLHQVYVAPKGFALVALIDAEKISDDPTGILALLGFILSAALDTDVELYSTNVGPGFFAGIPASHNLLMSPVPVLKTLMVCVQPLNAPAFTEVSVVSPKYILSMEAQFEKALGSSDTRAGRFTLVREVQSLKVALTITVADGRFTPVRDVQLEKASRSIYVTTGRLMLFRDVHIKKAICPIRVTAGRLTLSRDAHRLKHRCPIVAAIGRKMLVRDVQLAKAASSITAAAGRFTRSRDVQREKAPFLITTATGRFTLSRDIQLLKAFPSTSLTAEEVKVVIGAPAIPSYNAFDGIVVVVSFRVRSNELVRFLRVAHAPPLLIRGMGFSPVTVIAFWGSDKTASLTGEVKLPYISRLTVMLTASDTPQKQSVNNNTNITRIKDRDRKSTRLNSSH